MNIDHILDTFNKHGVAYLLIGGVNFLLRHSPVLTYDIDLWIEDSVPNLRKCEKALADLDATWGQSDEDWGPVSKLRDGWLNRQSVFCLTSRHGAIDIFKNVAGLPDWTACEKRSIISKTETGVTYRGISDADMLKSQESLDETERDMERIALLKEALKG